ncbi:MAG: MFS transporter [Proteobacteria bacterium]|nr:MFS transporter [Pseudomonadota bacterium]
MTALAQYFSGYKDSRMPRIFLLGVISGFPWVLIGSALTLWLKEDGLSRSTVGFAGLIFGVYAINFLWSPLVDRLRVPYLTQLIGKRKAWIVVLQCLIMLGLLAWSLLDASTDLTWVVAIGLIIAIASATQDIAIDALRIEQVAPHESQAMAAGAAMSVVGWWSGFKLGGAAVFFIADYIQALGVAHYWQVSFLLVVAMVLVMNLALLLIPEASPPSHHTQSPPNKIWHTLTSQIKQTVIDPFWSFFAKNGVRIGLMILTFVFLFKIGEAFLGRMSIVFYREIGFSKSEIGIYSKGLGWVVTVAFTLIGGWFSMHLGSWRALFIAGIAMASTNVLFSVLAWVGKVDWLFAITVAVDDLAAAFATVAFVTFISLLVDRRYTASQYALLASLGTAGRTLLAASSGLLVDSLGGDWGVFFIITALMVTPSLILLLRLRPVLRATDKAITP